MCPQHQLSLPHKEETGSPVGSDKVADEEGEDLDDEDEYDEEEEEDDDDRPRKKARHGGFILDEAGKNKLFTCVCLSFLFTLKHCFPADIKFVFCPFVSLSRCG